LLADAAASPTSLAPTALSQVMLYAAVKFDLQYNLLQCIL